MAVWLVYKCSTCGAETKVNVVHADQWDCTCWRGHKTLQELVALDGPPD